MQPSNTTCTAFAGTKKIAGGSLLEVAATVKNYCDQHPTETLLIFDDTTSLPVEIDLRGTVEEVFKRLSVAEGKESDEGGQDKPGPGRPKLGVVSREIGLLPRHWEWLALQPGGASVTLRKLVEEAKKSNTQKDSVRLSQNAAYKFMSAMAGNLPHFEEATRAFFAKNKALFVTLCAGWPKDIREHVLKVGDAALSASEDA